MARVEIREGMLVVSLPEGRYFRLEDAATHEAIKGQGLTDVDFAWMADDDAHLWLMELKDYGPDSPGDLGQSLVKLRDQLPKNFVHAALVVSSIWARTPFGKTLRADIEATFPGFPEAACPMRAVAIIHLENPQDVALLAGLQDAIIGAVRAMRFDAVLVLPTTSTRLTPYLGIAIRRADVLPTEPMHRRRSRQACRRCICASALVP